MVLPLFGLSYLKNSLPELFVRVSCRSVALKLHLGASNSPKQVLFTNFTPHSRYYVCKCLLPSGIAPVKVS